MRHPRRRIQPLTPGRGIAGSAIGSYAGGAEETQVRVHPIYFLQGPRPRLDQVSLGISMAQLLPGAVSRFGLGHTHEYCTWLSALRGRVVYVEGPRLQKEGETLVEAGWSRKRLEARLGPPARVIRRRGLQVLLYPRCLARVHIYGGHVARLEVGVEPYHDRFSSGDAPEGQSDFTPAEVRAVLGLEMSQFRIPHPRRRAPQGHSRPSWQDSPASGRPYGWEGCGLDSWRRRCKRFLTRAALAGA